MPTPIVLDMYHGDIVSSWEQIYDAGIRGIIHKASQGSSLQDKKYAMRKPEAIKYGLLWGAYHFGDDSDVETQVNNFLSMVGDTSSTLLALDFEPNPKGGTMSLSQAKQWLQMVTAKTGQKPVIYSGHLIKEKLTREDEFFGSHRLWLAQYGKTPKLPPSWNKYWLWQYTGDGIGEKPHAVTGFQGDADLNVFYNGEGSFDQLKAEWLVKAEWLGGSTPVSPEEPVSTVVETPETTETESSGDLPWMKVAKSHLGLKEIQGSQDNPEILSWAKKMGMSDYNHDSIPWCALFVAHCVSEAGEDITDAPLWALSWKAWGAKLDEPCYGALMVFKRNGGGHVGFYISEDSNYYHILGGNQSDMVSVSKVAKANCVAWRWPADKMNLAKGGRIKAVLDSPIISDSQMA